MELRNFEKTDWYGYAGAEGENPKIGEIQINDTDGYIVVVDEGGIEVDKVMMAGIGNKTWHLPTTNQPEGELIAGAFTAQNIEATLTQWGADLVLED